MTKSTHPGSHRFGVVATISGFFAACGANIAESQHFLSPLTNGSYMGTVFTEPARAEADLAAGRPEGLLYKVKVIPEMRVRMRDGVELAVRIIRPEADGRFPAIMTYNPYRSLTMLKAAPSEREYSSMFNGPHYFAERGYIFVQYDVRGTGSSGGFSAEMYSDAERQDGYHMVEWIAGQPWSNGSVGMWGLSYGAVAAWQVAAMAPPHLKAIIVGSGTDDVYEDWVYPGGVPRSVVTLGSFASAMTALNFAPPDPVATGGKWADIWDARLKNNVPWSLAFLNHQTDGAYWRSRSLRPDYGRIRCAVFVISGWGDWYPTAMLRAFTNLKVPKRALIGPWGHSWPEDAFPGPRIDARPEYLKWFNQFLKGVNTGVLQEPPITIYVNRHQPLSPTYKEQAGFWRHEKEWPLMRTRYTALYFESHGRLEPTRAENVQLERDQYRYRASVGVASGMLAITQPLDQRPDELYSLNYTTAPLDADLEVTGNPSANLFVSSSAEVAYFHVRVSDVAPDGTSKLITDGGLNATHRNSHSSPARLKPREVYELKFALKSVAYIFPAGHRIRVSVSSADFQNTWPVSKAATNTLIRGAKYPSRVILPVAPPQTALLPAPRLLPSPNPIPEVAPVSGHTITHDEIRQTTTLAISHGVNGTTFTVSDRKPEEAIVKSNAEYVVSGAGDIKVHAQAVTSSDANVFRHLVDVEVTVDGKRHFSKSWAISVPRVLN